MRSLIWLLKFSFKDVWQQKKVYLFLIINLFIGTFGFLAIQFFQSSLKLDLANRSQNMLGGDYTISSSRNFTNEELKLLETEISYDQKTSVVEFFAMLKNNDQNRLVSVRAFNDLYPFYGKIGSDQESIQYNSDTLWIDPELVKMLKVDAKSAEMKLGDHTFTDVKTITQDSSRFFRGAGLAPVIYISQKNLPRLGLITQGSTLRTFLIYKSKPQANLDAMKQKFNNKITDNTIKFETAEERSESGNNIFKYFVDYLGLVAIISISLCFLSGGYLMRWAFEQKVTHIAIYKTLGMSDRKIQWIQIIQILTISIVSFALSFLLFKSLLPFLNYYFTSQNLPFVLTTHATTTLFSFLLSVAAPLVMFMPINISISHLNPKDLFLNQAGAKQGSVSIYLWSIFCIASFWGLALYQSKSYKVSSLFTFGIIIIILALKLFLSVFLKFLDKNIHRWNLHWTSVYAIRTIINKKKIADIVFITFTMAVLVLTLLPHIKQSIISEITPTNRSSLPRLFMFDVQSAQKPQLESLAESHLKTSLDFIPLVRSRILKINNQDYNRVENNGLSTREEDEEVRFRNRGVNLTYQNKLKASETITDGTWNEKNFSGTGLPEISLEERYATRVGAKINDEMTFDVQGLEIKGKVTSLRKVRWTSFNPNFFIVFQPGVLEEAPQNFLSSVSTQSDYNAFQNAVVEKFPNISVIDVKQTVEGILVFVDQMSMALQMMAIISIILGLFIFIVLIKTQIQERINEFNLLKTLGTDTVTIQKILRLQFMFILSLSLIIGIGLGMLLTHILINTVFNISTQFDFISVAVIGLALGPIALIIIYQATRFLNKLSPLSLIRS